MTWVFFFQKQTKELNMSTCEIKRFIIRLGLDEVVVDLSCLVKLLNYGQFSVYTLL